MGVTAFIAGRLRRGGKDSGQSSANGYIAVAGISLSMAVMLLSVSIVLGFKNQIREKVFGLEAAVTVSHQETYDEFGRYATPNITIEDLERVKALMPSVGATITMSVSGVLKTADDFVGLEFKGIDKGRNLDFVNDAVVSGCTDSLSLNTKSLVISAATAKSLKLTVGDKVDAYFFTGETLKARRFTVVAIYDTNFAEHDATECYAALAAVQSICDVDENVGDAIEITPIAPDSIATVTEYLNNRFYDDYFANPGSRLVADNVLHKGAAYLNWLDLLDMNVVVILCLMAIVSGFTLVSCLFILILERVNFIGMVKSMGATNSQIVKIFVWLAERIVLRGVLIGNVIGLGLAFLQWKYHFIPLNPEAYYLSSVPIEFNLWAILGLNAAVIALSTAIMLIPARLISNISPSETMRYE